MKMTNQFKWQDYVDEDVPLGGVSVSQNSSLFQNRYRGSARVANNRIWDPHAYEEKRKERLNRQLP